MKKIEKFSFGMGDRFGRQGRAQLQAVARARADGIEITLVWNKSNREHVIVGSQPMSVLREAQAATAALDWTGPWHVDADHINLTTVDRFIEASDFYTIDVADYIGRASDNAEVERFVGECARLVGALKVPGLPYPLEMNRATVETAARKFLWAAQEAGRVHRHIAKRKGDEFIAEVSLDETDRSQTPGELLLILFMLAREGVPAQTVAPKFTGSFHKGVDYVGDLATFEQEFEADLCVARYAVAEFGLPDPLKLSVHSGSDKFSLYPIINRLLRKHNAGVHLKTAGTTWLEEVIGLAEAGGEGLALAQEIYALAHARFDELVKPYATVVAIDRTRLPSPAEVGGWSSDAYVAALRHDAACAAYNPEFRQFIHVSFKIAAEMGTRYLDALKTHETVIARNVTGNLYERHLRPLFGS